MSEIEELKAEIRKLREEIAELKARPQVVNHYHYTQPLLPAEPPQPGYPQWPVVWAADGMGGGVRSEGDWARSTVGAGTPGEHGRPGY